MMKKKPYIEKDKALAERRLIARLEILKSKGIADELIQRDTTVRHFKGEIRQAKYRLASIAEVEKLMVRKAEIKVEKLATPKVNPPKKSHAADPEKKKAKMEKKRVVVETDEE